LWSGARTATDLALKEVDELSASRTAGVTGTVRLAKRRIQIQETREITVKG